MPSALIQAIDALFPPKPALLPGRVVVTFDGTLAVSVGGVTSILPQATDEPLWPGRVAYVIPLGTARTPAGGAVVVGASR